MAYIRLARPINAGIAGLVVLVGAWLAGWPGWQIATIASVSGALLIAWANVDNDILDLETDRLAHPDRPIPKGEVRPEMARNFSWFLLIPGMALSAFLPPVCTIVFLSAMILTTAYNRLLKRIPLVSNTAVSTAAALGFLFGGFTGKNTGGPLWAFLLAFLFHMAREGVKSLEDASADKVSGRRTVPVLWGERAGLILTTVSACLMIGLTPLPFISGHLGLGYLIAVVLLVDGVWAGLLIYLWARRNYGLVSKIAKADMLAALVALVLGKIG
ncbi:MAG: geranylgeranylglycerol-phosphate geranylgeranyltransferase [candidate division WOR-3 bacterium]